MALTYNDLNFVTQSARSLDDTLTNKRRERQQQGQFDEDMAMRRHLLQRQLERDQMANKLGEDRNKLLQQANTDRNTAATVKQAAVDRETRVKRMEAAFNWMKDGVDKGVLPPDKANEMLKAALANADDEAKAVMAEHPLGQMLMKGGDVFTAKTGGTDNAPSDVATDREAAKLEAEATKAEQSGDTATAASLRKRAESLRSGIGRKKESGVSGTFTGDGVPEKLTGDPDAVAEYLKRKNAPPVKASINVPQGGIDLGGGATLTKKLTPEMAEDMLKEAGGDKDKARQVARERGFSF